MKGIVALMNTFGNMLRLIMNDRLKWISKGMK